jgi:uncharacterized protein involved in tolerance to divalent cations
MVPEPSQREPLEPNDPPYPDFEQVLSTLPNAELLAALELALLELEKRLYRCAHVDTLARSFFRWPTKVWCWL